MINSIWKAHYKGKEINVSLQFICKTLPEAIKQAEKIGKKYDITLYLIEQIYLLKGKANMPTKEDTE